MDTISKNELQAQYDTVCEGVQPSSSTEESENLLLRFYNNCKCCFYRKKQHAGTESFPLESLGPVAVPVREMHKLAKVENFMCVIFLIGSFIAFIDLVMNITTIFLPMTEKQDALIIYLPFSTVIFALNGAVYYLLTHYDAEDKNLTCALLFVPYLLQAYLLGMRFPMGKGFDYVFDGIRNATMH